MPSYFCHFSTDFFNFSTNFPHSFQQERSFPQKSAHFRYGTLYWKKYGKCWKLEFSTIFWYENAIFWEYAALLFRYRWCKSAKKSAQILLCAQNYNVARANNPIFRYERLLPFLEKTPGVFSAFRSMAVLPSGGKNAFCVLRTFFAVLCLKKCFCRRRFPILAGSANPAKLGSGIVLPCFYARSSTKRTKKVSRIFKKISADM